jgi:hypothetical protein
MKASSVKQHSMNADGQRHSLPQVDPLAHQEHPAQLPWQGRECCPGCLAGPATPTPVPPVPVFRVKGLPGAPRAGAEPTLEHRGETPNTHCRIGGALYHYVQ